MFDYLKMLDSLSSVGRLIFWGTLLLFIIGFSLALRHPDDCRILLVNLAISFIAYVIYAINDPTGKSFWILFGEFSAFLTIGNIYATIEICKQTTWAYIFLGLLMTLGGVVMTYYLPQLSML